MSAPASVPRWLELQAEIDFAVWQLNELRRELAKPVSPLDALIDAATGWQKELADELIERIRALRAEYDAEVGTQR